MDINNKMIKDYYDQMYLRKSSKTFYIDLLGLGKVNIYELRRQARYE